MFGTLTCCIRPTSQPAENPQDKGLLEKHQKWGLITDIALGAIIFTAGMLTLLALNGVNIGALNAMGAMGPMAGGIMILAPIALLIGDLIGALVVVTKNARHHLKHQTPETDDNGLRDTLVQRNQKIEELNTQLNAAALNTQTGRSPSDTEANQQLEKLEQEIASQKEVSAGLKRSNQAMIRQREALTSELGDLHDQRSQVMEELDSHGNQLRTALASLQAAKAELGSTNSKVKAAQPKLKALNSTVQEKNRQLKQLEADIDSKTSELEKLQATFDKIKANEKELVEEVRLLKAEKKALEKAPEEEVPPPPPPPQPAGNSSAGK